MAKLDGTSRRRYQFSDCLEGELKIVNQIADIFHPDRKPNKRIGDAERFAFLFWHRGVRHERGMVDQTLDAAQTFREREQARVLRKRFVPARSVFKTIVTIPPKPRIWVRARSCWGCDFNPG